MPPTPTVYTAQAALDTACSSALVNPHWARTMAHVALLRAEQDGHTHVGTAALSLYVTLGGNFRGAGMA